MKKILINVGPEKFILSQKALKILHSKKDNPVRRGGDKYRIPYFDLDDYRYDKDIIEIVESLGKESTHNLSIAKIIQIPKDTKYYIINTGSGEEIHEEHTVWK